MQIFSQWAIDYLIHFLLNSLPSLLLDIKIY